MLRKVYVWGDSIAKGIVFDAARGRYVGLRERSGFSARRRRCTWRWRTTRASA